MRILYNNLIKTATIAASSENENYPFSTALNDSRLSRYARTTSNITQWIKFSFSTHQYIDYIAILNHNISERATIVLEANNEDSWATPAYSLTIPFTLKSSNLYDLVDESYNNIIDESGNLIVGGDYIYNSDLIAEVDNTNSFLYWRLTIDDPNNTDGFLQISKIFLGESLDMPGMNLDQSIFRKSTATARKSNSGQLYGEKRLKYKTASISFSDVTNTKKEEINTFFDYVDLSEPFILIMWEDNLDIEPPIYVNLTKDIEYNRMTYQGLLWQFTLNIEECF